MAYSILSMDGGGTWALIHVRILQQRYGEKAGGHEILRKYNMVIANSGGSLVLAAMCADMTLDKILDVFNDEDILKTVFSHTHGIKPLLGFERFSTEQKIIGLRTVLKDCSSKYLDELPAFIGRNDLEIIITGFDYDSERAKYFRSNKASMMEGDNIISAVNNTPAGNPGFDRITLLHAIHASSNAPVLFFDEPATVNYDGKAKPRLFWDGAVGGNNNPVAVGVFEALANGHPKDEIRIASLGTSGNVLPVLYGEENDAIAEYDWLVRRSQIMGDLAEVKKLAGAILDDPPDAATFMANQLLGLPNVPTNPRLIRINPLLKAIYNEHEKIWMLPGKSLTAAEIEKLYKMDMAVTDKEDVVLINKLCDDFFENRFDNQGIRTGSKKIEAILGHKTFSRALSDWNAWTNH